MLNWQIRRRLTLFKSRLALTIILIALIVLLLGGIGMIGFNLSSISPTLLNGIGWFISAILLALIIAMDLTFVVLIVRTPNRWQQP